MAIAGNFVEEWKGVIDFAKTVLSISTGLLTAISSLLLIGNYRLEGLGWIPPALLIASASMSLYGFGRAIQALRSGVAKNAALLLCNISVMALIAAVVSAPFTMQTNASPLSVDQVLDNVESSTKKWPVDLSARNCTTIVRKGDELTLTYQPDGRTVQVVFSSNSKTIRQIQ